MWGINEAESIQSFGPKLKEITLPRQETAMTVNIYTHCARSTPIKFGSQPVYASSSSCFK